MPTCRRPGPGGTVLGRGSGRLASRGCAPRRTPGTAPRPRAAVPVGRPGTPSGWWPPPLRRWRRHSPPDPGRARGGGGWGRAFLTWGEGALKPGLALMGIKDACQFTHVDKKWPNFIHLIFKFEIVEKRTQKNICQFDLLSSRAECPKRLGSRSRGRGCGQNLLAGCKKNAGSIIRPPTAPSNPKVALSAGWATGANYHW